jgi:hypothetical protein
LLLRIGNADDAKSVVRKHIIGTRSRHRKIASIVIDEKIKGPDDKGMWTMHGVYVTQDGGKEQFAAFVTSKGEVRITVIEPDNASGRRSLAPGRR